MPEEKEKGLIIVHTGPGKGKTTAALGLGFRAVGSGLRVLMVQFIKGSWHYGELDAAKMLGADKFVIRPMGRGFVKLGGEIDPADKKAAQEAWAFAREKIFSGEYDMIILDEINYAISYGLLGVAPVAEALEQKPDNLHVVLTGRNAAPEIVAMADLVTEMREIKHPYQKGIDAQRGIEY
jgi:cob(I)alamin adenosyltransferase